jgi:hypothetical protein
MTAAFAASDFCSLRRSGSPSLRGVSIGAKDRIDEKIPGSNSMHFGLRRVLPAPSSKNASISARTGFSAHHREDGGSAQHIFAMKNGSTRMERT